jgi:hypothetical protein
MILALSPFITSISRVLETGANPKVLKFAKERLLCGIDNPLLATPLAWGK